MVSLTLFGICPACGQPSPADDLACGACVDAARPYIRRADGTPPTDGELAALLGEAGDPEPEAAPVDIVPPAPPTLPPAPQPKQNQRCWACEERRTCAPDPGNAGHWICPACLEL
jgi:hypothetical protein